MTQRDMLPTFVECTVLNAPRYQPKVTKLVRGGGFMFGIHKSVDYREIKDYSIRGK